MSEQDAIRQSKLLPETQRCGARTRRGGFCGHPAGYGTDHAGSGRCKFHGGSTRNGRLAAAKERIAAVVPRATSGIEAIDRALAFANGLTDALERELERVGGAEVVRKDELAAIVKLAREQHRELATLGKLASDAGVAERRLRMEEALAAELRDAIRGILSELGVLDHPSAPEVVRRHLLPLEAGPR